MSFGPVGRGWQPRLGYAGTYDQAWLDDVFPFLPADFRDDYYQAAPADQQIPYLEGGEEVMLFNLTPEGRAGFRLPKLEMPVVFFLKTYEKEETRAVADTLVIEPDARRFVVCWRASRPLKRNIFEVVQVLVGTMPRAWWRARELGKTYYPSLAEMAAAKKRERRGVGGMTRAAHRHRRRRHDDRRRAERTGLVRRHPLRHRQLHRDPVHGPRRRVDRRQRGAAGAAVARAGEAGQAPGRRRCASASTSSRMCSAEDIPLLVCVAERERPGRLDGLDNSLFFELQNELGLTFHAESEIFAEGRVGGVAGAPPRPAAAVPRRGAAPARHRLRRRHLPRRPDARWPTTSGTGC